MSAKIPENVQDQEKKIKRSIIIIKTNRLISTIEGIKRNKIK